MHFSNWLVSVLSSTASRGASLRHAFSTLAMYSSLGEHLDTTAKLGPLANRVSCASIWGIEERLTIHLALMLLSNVVVVVVVFISI